MKERLTGAIILVALIVLLVPELLTGPLRGKPTAGIAVRPSTVSVDSPAGSRSSQPEPPIRSYTLSLTNAAPVTGATAAGGLAAAKAPGGQTAPSAVQAKGKVSASPPSRAAAITAVAPTATASRGEAPSEAPPEVTPARRAKTSTAIAGGPKRSSRAAMAHRPAVSPGWVVQLGYFSVHANALRLARRLRVKGFRVSVSPSRVRGRILWRVWSGPVGSRAAAAHLARRLRSAGLRGEVLPG